MPEPSPAPHRELAGDTTLLLDRYLPRYDLAVVHAQVFRVPPAVCYRAALAVDLLRHPVSRVLLDLRSLPPRLAERLTGHGSTAAGASRRTFRIGDMARPPINWLLLAEEPDVEICLGEIARPWTWTATVSVPAVAPAEFPAFNRPGFAKIAFSLSVRPYGTTGTILTMETRVALTDRASLRQFRRYWILIGPFSHVVRRIALRLLAADLRRQVLTGSPEVTRGVRSG